MRRKGHSSLRVAGLVLGVALLLASVVYLADAVEAGTMRRVASALLADPAGLALALLAYAGAFGLRTWAWRRTLTGLPTGQAWAALHVSLLGNHVLPLRMGEALRVTSVVRRTALPVGPVTASALTLRAADVLAVLGLAAVAGPEVLMATGRWGLLVAGVALGAALAGVVWSRRLGAEGAHVRLPGGGPLAATVLAWALEAAVVWEVARVAGIGLTPWQAVAVTATTIAAQTVAVTPGGFGTYEAAATAAMVALGVPAAEAFAVALTTHAVKTAYALVVGAYALQRPEPGYWGRFRLPCRLPPRPRPRITGRDAPVVAMVPVHDEEPTIAEVIRRLPRTVQGHRVVALVVDDGSTDRSAQEAHDAGAVVVAHPRNLGLGAAVRRGLAEATALDPAAVVYLDADWSTTPRSSPGWPGLCSTAPPTTWSDRGSRATSTGCSPIDASATSCSPAGCAG